MSRQILNGLNMVGTPIDNLPDAISNQQPATLGQLNAAIEGRKNKNAVRVAATGNITLSGLQTIDGVSVSAGDRVGATYQSTASARGIYIAASGAWTRAADANSAAEIENMEFAVLEGTANAGKRFLNTNAIGSVTLGTTSLTFIISGNGGASYTEGLGIDITSSVIAIDTGVVARKMGADIGDGSATSFNVSHSLDSTDVIVLIREKAGGKAEVEADVVFTDANTVTISFAAAPSAGQYRVSVIG